MKKNIILIFLITAVLLSVSCSSSKSVNKKLIGRWKVELAEFSTGEVVKDPDMIIEFTQDIYTVYTKGKKKFFTFL